MLIGYCKKKERSRSHVGVRVEDKEKQMGNRNAPDGGQLVVLDDGKEHLLENAVYRGERCFAGFPVFFGGFHLSFLLVSLSWLGN